MEIVEAMEHTPAARVIEPPSFSLGLTDFEDNGILFPAIDGGTGGGSSSAGPLIDVSDFTDTDKLDGDVRAYYDLMDLSNADPKPKRKRGGKEAEFDEFLAQDEKFQDLVDAGGKNLSIGVDTWALNRLHKFREFIHDNSIAKELVDLESRDVVQLLCRFFEQVKKKNGNLYPTESLMGMLRAFNRVIRKEQERRIMTSGIDEPPFSMKASPMFRRVCVACIIAMKRSKDNGANLPRKKSKVVKLTDERTAMDNEYLGKYYARGLQRRVGVYCEFRLSIRGAGELYNTRQDPFSFGTDENGRYMLFEETKSTKASRPSMKKFQQEHFRAPVKIYEEDVVDTFERYFKRLPEGMENLFLKPIDNPRGLIWYGKQNVGEGTLENFVNLAFLEAGVENDGGKKVTNKSGKTSMITRMAENGVPPEVGMLLSGHKSKGAYQRYDQSGDARIRATQRCQMEEINYDLALAEEKLKTREHTFGKDGGAKEEITEALVLVSAEKSVQMQVQFAREDPSATPAITVDRKGKAIMESSSAVTVSTKGKEILTGDQVQQGSTSKGGKGKVIVNEEDYSWMDAYDWDNDLQEYQGERANVLINPTKAVFGKIGALNNCNITFHIHGMNMST